ncbi:hypothetical protein J2X77_001374 [Sphingobacterium sp. 2149]|nr:hypothetical protein [Sphingobacterium sp. 2149]
MMFTNSNALCCIVMLFHPKMEVGFEFYCYPFHQRMFVIADVTNIAGAPRGQFA